MQLVRHQGKWGLFPWIRECLAGVLFRVRTAPGSVSETSSDSELVQLGGSYATEGDRTRHLGDGGERNSRRLVVVGRDGQGAGGEPQSPWQPEYVPQVQE